MPRPALPKDLRLIYKVSRLYYEDNCTEDEIAARFSISRSKVSRLLKQAREAGIVTISVISPPGFYPRLEEDLEKRFYLRDAVVVEVSNPNSAVAVAHELGAVAARYLIQTLRDKDIIGISWGRTLNAMITSIQPQRAQGIQIVQIIGGLGPPTSEVYATDLCRRLAGALGCGLSLLPAPGIMSSPQSKEAILQDTHVQQVMALYPLINVAYVGIGAPTPDSVGIGDGSNVSQEELKGLLEKGVVGDIALRYFDRFGQPIQTELNDRIIGITLEELKRIERVVGIAGGAEKIPSIMGALKGGYISVLVTDQATAQNLLEAEEMLAMVPN
jgi:DNA-binding transcriptional regulator LsrR (DeoR family)